jgi:hypothetical protein
MPAFLECLDKLTRETAVLLDLVFRQPRFRTTLREPVGYFALPEEMISAQPMD